MNIENKIIEYRRYIHKNPEIGYETYNTASFVNKILTELGYKTKMILNNSAVIAYLDLGFKKTIALRTDMDALPIVEQVESEYKSCNTNMHACGHDCHTAMLLGASELIINDKNLLKSNIRLIFQCAEEGPLPGGAVKVLETGLLDDVDEFYALHVNNNYKVGEVAIKSSEAFSGPDFFDVEVVGKGAHGSTPELGNNPIIPLSQIALEINSMIEEMRKTTACAATVTKLNAGSAYNVIEDKAILGGTIRTFNIETRNTIANNITNICKNIESKYKVKATFRHYLGYDPLYNHPESVNKFIEIASSTKEITNVIKLEKPTMVGEDFTYYIKNKPGCIAWLGVRNEKNDEIISLHSPNFYIDEKALIIGTKLLYNIALKS